MIYLLAILLVIFAILTWRNLETGVLIICALLPSYLIRFSIANVPTTFLELMVLIVCGIWMWKSRKILLDKFRLEKSWWVIIGFFLIAATIGIFISPDKHAALGVWKAFYLEPILFFFVIHDLLRSNKATKDRIFLALGLSALLVSLFGLIQYIFDIGIPIPWDIERRITGVFDYPNALALFLEPIIVISWFQIVRMAKDSKGLQRTPKDLLFWIVVSFFSTVNVFLAQSEAGMAALIITAICILLAIKQTRRQTIATVLVLAALAFAIPTTRNYLVQKFTFQDYSENVRLSQWTETLNLLKDHPIFGVGLSGYPIALVPYHKATYLEIFQYPHDVLLNVWVELGLIGLIAFFLLAIQIVRVTMKRNNDRTGGACPSPSYNFLFFVFLEMTIHGLVDVPYFKNDLAMLTWILLALFIFELNQPSNNEIQ